MGRYPLRLDEIAAILAGALTGQGYGVPPAAAALLLRVRLPRILAAVLIGAGLVGAGTAFQGLFKNPLVDSNLLGVTSGAGFGAALALLLTGNLTLASLAAFGCGLAAVLLAYFIARQRDGTHTLMLTLAGILVGSFFSSLTSLVKTLVDPLETLPAITFWLLGGLNDVTWRDLPLLAAVTGLGATLLVLLRWQLNVLSLGDREAQALGVNTRRMKLVIMGLASLMTAAAVAVGGVIGWVGLVIPHAGRMLVGPDHKRLLPVSLSLGAVFLLALDTLARTLLAREVPLGVFTGIVGAPVLLLLLRRGRTGWQSGSRWRVGPGAKRPRPSTKTVAAPPRPPACRCGWSTKRRWLSTRKIRRRKFRFDTVPHPPYNAGQVSFRDPPAGRCS